MTEQAASQILPANDCVLRLHGCPCGYYGDPVKQCTCTPSLVSRYQKRISGPFLDRIDIFMEVPRLEYEKLARTIADPSTSLRAGLAGAETIATAHLAEAIQYRPRGLVCSRSYR